MAEANKGAGKPILDMEKVTEPGGRVIFKWNGKLVEKPKPTGYDSSGNPIYPKEPGPTTNKKG